MTKNILPSSSTTPVYFPSDVLKWMKKNAMPRAALKLMQVCKYFQHTNYLLVSGKNLSLYSKKEIFLYLNGKQNWIKEDALPKNIWLTASLYALSPPYAISNLLKKVAICEIKVMKLRDQEITINEFKFLTSSANLDDISIEFTKIELNNGEPCSLEDIFNCLINVSSLTIEDNIPPYNSKTDTRIPKLQFLNLYNIAENFNFSEFSEFMIENQKIQYTCSFSDGLSLGQIKIIEKCVKKLNKVWDTQNKRPDIFDFKKQKNSIFSSCFNL